MGKIKKSKRHKKIKAIGERNNLLLKDAEKIDATPIDSKEQEIPRRWQEMMDGRQKIQNHSYKQKKKKKKEAPVFVQRKGESQQKLFRRLNKATSQAMNRVKIEEKFKVKIVENEKGEIAFEKEEKAAMSDNQKQRLLKKKAQTKLQRLRKQTRKDDDFKKIQDEVKFGEVVLAPPRLTAKPRKATLDVMPGTKSLLLKQIMSENIQSQLKKTNRPLGTSVKRKYLPLADRRQLDLERERVIETYRQLKKQKQKTPNE